MATTEFRYFWRAYVEAALWSSNALEDGDNDTSMLDMGLGESDIERPSWIRMVREAYDAWDRLTDCCCQYGVVVDPHQLGHDHWLTRNRHGAGHWCRGLGEAGEALTQVSHKYRPVGLHPRWDASGHCTIYLA